MYIAKRKVYKKGEIMSKQGENEPAILIKEGKVQ